MFYNQNKTCVKLCQKHCFKKPIVLKKRIVFQHVHFLIPLFWNEKLSLPIGLSLWKNNAKIAILGNQNP